MTAAVQSRRAAAGPLPPRWPWLFRLFRRYARRYVARHFHAVRVSKAGPSPKLGREPAIMVLNHPSWWDPLLCYVLSERWPGRTDWGVIDTVGLRQYRFLSRAGQFGIEPDSTRGAVQFLRTATAILADPAATLWLTAQGRFADVRERPVRLRSGVGHLATRLDRGVIVPVALEYPFWDQRTPEALVRFGEPLAIAGGRPRSAQEWTALVAAELELTMDALAAEARSRDESRFDVILRGRAGVGGVYDGWRRLVAGLRGRRFDPAHRTD